MGILGIGVCFHSSHLEDGIGSYSTGTSSEFSTHSATNMQILISKITKSDRVSRELRTRHHYCDRTVRSLIAIATYTYFTVSSQCPISCLFWYSYSKMESQGLWQDVKGYGRTPDDYEGTPKDHGWTSKGYSGQSRAAAGRQREQSDARNSIGRLSGHAKGPRLGVKGLQRGV